MLKGKVLIRFRGENYSTIYETGKIYDFEDARAKNLAFRGLIEIVSEVVEKPLANEAKEKPATIAEPKEEQSDTTEAKAEEESDTQEQAMSDIFPAESERKARGRQRKTE